MELIRERELLGKKDHERMWALRMRFLDQCKHYFGVPYAKRYQTKGTPEYDAPFFLDCCGLVRRVLMDLKEDFGFKVDSWNQAYQYDILPITITEEEMKPGDLVFISGTYFNKKSKKQKHDMVHVEVWLGDGPKTIGARWQKGKVQVFDSYRFVSKSYHNMVYHFKSIDTWLQGICRSYCDEHPWTRTKYKPGKKSIFSLQRKQKGEEEEELEEAADASDADEEQEPNDAEEEEMEREEKRDKQGDVDGSDREEVRLRTKMSKDQEQTVEEAMVKLSVETSGPSIDCHGNHEEMENDLTSLDEEFPPELEQGDGEDKRDDNDYIDGNYDDALGYEGAYYRTDAQIEDSLREDNQHKDEGEPSPPAPADTKTMSEPSESFNTLNNPNSNNNNSNNDADWGCYDNNPNSKEGDGGKGGSTSCPSGEAGGLGRGENGSKTGKDSSKSKEKKDGKNGDRGGGGGGGGRERKSPGDTSGRKSVMQVDTSPTFYIGGNNGVSLIEGALVTKGWRRMTEKHSNQFRLKWVELRSSINFNAFKPGEQLVNRIPNSGGILGTKTGLFNTLREYERVCDRTRGGGRSKYGLKIDEFFPESYILDLKPDRDVFLQTFKEGEIWISKPNGMNQGKGIYLVRDISQLQERYRQREEEATSSKAMQRRTRGQGTGQRLIQRYIPNPLLLKNKKFDVRAYMLIACTNPYIVLYHNGYLRLSCEDYDPESTDISTHLTNQFVQKKNPNYQDIKEDTVWSMDAFSDHVNQHLAEDKGLPKDWVKGFFQKRMCQIMSQCFLAAKNKLDTSLGYFDLLGFDFLLDTDMKIWLLEINVNPALHTNCEVLKELLPGVVDETLDIVIEIQEKVKRKQPIMPLSKRRQYQLLYDDTSGGSVPSMRPPTRKAMPSSTSTNEGSTTSRSARSSVSPQRAISKAKSLPRQVMFSPRQVGNATSRQVSNTTPRQVGNSTPRQVGNSTPRQAGNTTPRQVGNATPRQVGNATPRQVGNTTPRQTVTSPRQTSTIPPIVTMPNRGPPLLHGGQLPVVKLTLRKNVTPLAPPVVTMHQGGAVSLKKSETEVTEATSKVKSIKL
ncbi:probable beta-tubulin polyglutamylase [Strongylocentrotus purpuratus]|uniref:NlpC/P60 domain-containing protein n=1 Tax=Strongylocentrotus purpuratus TaxID=7668 RepID=A0A7M7SZL1_STRPU|nr:probable beta-tubulin polyglutamylase [Strongylocentrotus purpuratus]